MVAAFLKGLINIARGNQAKEWVSKKIIETFGQDNVIEYDKKLYITTKEDGAPIQIALTLTCPKNMVGVEATTASTSLPKSAFSGGLDFETMGATTAAPAPTQPAEISEKERETVIELMKRLGL